MISMKDYKTNPCRTLSIPYWKAKDISIPPDMQIVHDSEFDAKLYDAYLDRTFFRLSHSLTAIPSFDENTDFLASGIRFELISSDKADELADMINLSYTHSEICVSADYIKNLTRTQVYCPELWLAAVWNGTLIGSILCDFDAEIGEGIIEWLQVLPEHRGKGIASALICKALRTMKHFAGFTTVSGECSNRTNPEKVYRKCGFEGNDIWHILRKQ